MCIGPAAAAYFEIDRVSERPSRIRGLVSTMYVFVQAACRLCINKSENGGKGEHSVMLFLKTAAYYISILHNNKFRDFEFRSPRIHVCTGTYVIDRHQRLPAGDVGHRRDGLCYDACYIIQQRR